MPEATLHINIGEGKFIQTMEIDIPNDVRMLTWRQNIENRQLYIDQMINELKIMYYNQIQKLGVYEISIFCKAEVLTKYNGVRQYISDLLEDDIKPAC